MNERCDIHSFVDKDECSCRRNIISEAASAAVGTAALPQPRYTDVADFHVEGRERGVPDYGDTTRQVTYDVNVCACGWESPWWATSDKDRYDQRLEHRVAHLEDLARSGKCVVEVATGPNTDADASVDAKARDFRAVVDHCDKALENLDALAAALTDARERLKEVDGPHPYAADLLRDQACQFEETGNPETAAMLRAAALTLSVALSEELSAAQERERTLREAHDAHTTDKWCPICDPDMAANVPDDGTSTNP